MPTRDELLPERRARLLARLGEPLSGFAIHADDEPVKFACRDVSGFREAIGAAYEAFLPAPRRLVLVDPDDVGARWLASWAEDCERVERALTVRRRFDGRKVEVVATIASYGRQLHTQLGVRALAAPTTAESAGKGGGVANDLSAPASLWGVLYGARGSALRRFKGALHARAPSSPVAPCRDARPVDD